MKNKKTRTNVQKLHYFEAKTEVGNNPTLGEYFLTRAIKNINLSFC